jgi:hypothetical protein
MNASRLLPLVLAAGMCFGSAMPANAVISNSGLLAEYSFETSLGLPVAAGQSAAGMQIDDTGFNPAGANHAIGSPLVGIVPLTYSSNVPAAIGGGRSLSFPGAESPDRYVAVPFDQGSALDNIAGGDFRVEAWFNTTDAGRSNIFSSFPAGGAGNNAFNLELNTSNNVRIYLQNGAAVEQINAAAPGITYSDGEWHKLIAVREAGQLTLTLDGVVAGSVASSLSFDQSVSEFRIGRDNRASGTPIMQGLVDNIRLYDSFDTSSPVAFFDFDTVGGLATVDGQNATGMVDETAGHLGGPFHGTGLQPAGTPAMPEYRADVPSALAGVSQRSLEFQEGNLGVEDARFTATTEITQIPLGDFTMETWFKTTDTTRSALISGWQNGNDRTFALELHTTHANNGVRMFIEGGNETVGDTDVNVSGGAVNTRDGEWHHVAARREGSDVSVWLDGVPIGSGTDIVGAFEMEVAMLRLGNDNRAGGLPFNGLLDNSRIWGRALSDGEIVELANGGSPVPEPGSTALIAAALVVCAGAAARRGRKCIAKTAE